MKRAARPRSLEMRTRGEAREPLGIEKSKRSHLYLLERYFEGEGLVIVRIQGTFLDTGLFLLQSLSALHQHDLDVRI